MPHGGYQSEGCEAPAYRRYQGLNYYSPEGNFSGELELFPIVRLLSSLCRVNGLRNPCLWFVNI